MHGAEARGRLTPSRVPLVIVGQERAAREEGEDETSKRARQRMTLTVLPKPRVADPQEAAAQPKAAPSFPALCSASERDFAGPDQCGGSPPTTSRRRCQDRTGYPVDGQPGDRCSLDVRYPRALNSTVLSRPHLQPALMHDCGDGVLKEEAQHFSAGIGPAWVSVGAGRTATGPRVPSSVQNPLF
jgi:hypothetical protein